MSMLLTKKPSFLTKNDGIFDRIQVKSGIFLTALTTLDREINCFCHVTAYTVIICSGRQTVELDLMLTGRRDQIAISVEQLKK